MSNLWYLYSFTYTLRLKHSITYGCIRRRALLRRLEVMVLHVDIRDDVVVNQGVLARSEIPRLFLWVVVAAFQPFQFVVEVNHVVGLLITKGSVLVPRQHINQILLLAFLNRLLSMWIIVHLSDWVVKGLLLFDELVGHFFVDGSLPLEIALLVHVLINVALPLSQALRQIVLLRKLPNICN